MRYSPPVAHDVVIAGGGFAGAYAARELEKVLPRQSTRLILVNDVNFLLYTPLLPEAAAGTLEPRHVVTPLRDILERTYLRLGAVTGHDPERHLVELTTHDGEVEELRYDQLLIALGSVSRSLPIPGLDRHAIGFKSLADAIWLRNHIVETLEAANASELPERRAELLTYVFVGGGYAGVEALAELQDFAADAMDNYPRARLQGMRWILVEARERVMMEIAPDLAEFASRELRGRGIEIRTGTLIDRVTERSVTLSSGEDVPTRTVCWTAGVKPHPVVAKLGLALTESGRIRADRFMQVHGRSDVWAIGDAAAVPDPARKGEASPPTAQHALRQGRTVARNVAHALGSGARPRPFRYRTLGVFVDMGRHQAVASTLGLKWRGFPAWFLARTYHLYAMPGFGRQLRLVTDWTVGLLFGRDSSELGQLGHPQPLEGLEEQSAGGTTGADAGADGADPAQPAAASVPHG